MAETLPPPILVDQRYKCRLGTHDWDHYGVSHTYETHEERKCRACGLRQTFHIDRQERGYWTNADDAGI